MHFIHCRLTDARLISRVLTLATGDMLQRELPRAPYNHEFHFGLAVALELLGTLAESKRHMAIALDFSTTRREHNFYAAKLDRMKGVN